MQYTKCRECIHNNASCRYKMAQAMSLIWNLETFMNLKEPSTSLYKCHIKLDFECTAFTQKIKEEKNNV